MVEALFEDMDMEALRQEWQRVFGPLPSLAARRPFYIGNLVYQRQVEAGRGLGLRVMKELEAMAGGSPARRKAELIVKPGTKLIRKRNGELHEVTVLEGGRYLYRGESFTSLSAVAKRITGHPWNGRIFFGLKKDPRRG